MDYEKLLNHFKKRRDYFESIDFKMNAKDLNDAINAIESLLPKENKDKKEDEKNSEENKEKG